jgi:signal transduction histidine kinase
LSGPGQTFEMAAAALGVAIGTVYLAVALVVLRQVRGAARPFPWLTVLAAFFVVRGLDRVTEAVTSERPPLVGHVADALVLLTLILIVFGLRRTVADVVTAREEAERRQERYGSALSNYERLTRHRLANPLAALRGGLATLRDVDTLSREERRQLLEMLEQQAVRLAEISLDPHRLSPEERELRPLPGRFEYPDAA